MNFIKRAFISIKCNLGKTCLLFLIVFILCSVISGTISANQAAENTERNLMDNMLTIAQVQVDWRTLEEENPSWMNDPNIMRALPPDMIGCIGALPYVETYDFFVETSSLFSPDLEQYEPEMSDGIFSNRWLEREGEFGRPFSARGGSNPNIFDIEQGLIELVAGRTFTEAEVQNPSTVALVSQAFAELNQLTIGSVMNFRQIIFCHQDGIAWDYASHTEDDIFASLSYELEVIGIFRPLSTLNTGDLWTDYDFLRRLANRIYVTNSFSRPARLFEATALVEAMADELLLMEDGTTITPEDWIIIDHFFSLHSASDFPAFREAVAEIVPPYFHVIDAGGNISSIEAALQSMRSLTLTILLLTIGDSILILSLLITLFLRERKYEVGIYLALGEKKRKLVSQFVVEIMVVAFVSIVAALFLGNVFSSILSENMLISDLTAEQEANLEQDMMTIITMWEDNPFWWQGFFNEVDTDEIIAAYDVSLNLMTILLFFAVGLGTTLIATIVPMLYVVRLNPRKIMM